MRDFLEKCGQQLDNAQPRTPWYREVGLAATCVVQVASVDIAAIAAAPEQRAPAALAAGLIVANVVTGMAIRNQRS